MSKILRLLDLSFEAWATLDHTFHERLAGDLYEAIEDVRNENNTSQMEAFPLGGKPRKELEMDEMTRKGELIKKYILSLVYEDEVPDVVSQAINDLVQAAQR